MSNDFALFGWSDRPDEVAAIKAAQPFPEFGAAATQFGIEGSGRGKTRLLYEYNKKANGGTYNNRVQAIGDCVSHGFARAVDILRAIQFVQGKGDWRAETATEITYGFGRIEIGGGRLGSGDGLVGAWAMEACKKYGTLTRGVYGKYDLRNYSGQRAKEWGNRGIPDELEPITREHLVNTGSLVSTWEELCDSIYQGYPIPVCSQQGFTNQRDKDGFLKPSGSWPHCMCIIGYTDEGPRPGVCFDQSWPVNWVAGPTTRDQPPGSFWVDADVVVKRMLSAQDSWALSDYVGYPPKLDDLGDIFT